jgi:hypothetical protein
MPSKRATSRASTSPLSRFRPLWIWRLTLVAFAIAYLASTTLQAWLPPIVPFLAAAAVEAQFFVTGVRASGASRAVDRGPQQRDLDELGWPDPEDEELPAVVTRPTHRVRSRLLQALLVLAVLGGVFWLDARGTHWQRLSPSARAATLAVLDREATRIAGHRATVICDVSGRHVGYVQDADGLAEVGGRRAWLTPAICYRLHQIRRSGRAAGASSGHAIAVLAHEAWHLHGEADEGRTNCFAYQSGVGVGEALGLSPSTARRLMHEQLATNPYDFEADRQYIVPDECHQGGSLDLHLDGGHFP